VPPRIENIPGSDTSYHMIDSIDCLFEGRTSTLCSANALRATQLIFGTYESARARKRVILPLKTDDSALLTMLERGEKAIPAWPAFLTDEEKEDGFELLYNGRDLTGWTQDSAAWTAERGILFGGHDEPGVIRTTKTFTNFSLVFEARFANRAEGSLFLRGCDADGALTGIEIPLVENRTDPVSKDSACGVRGVVAPNQDPRFGSSRWLWIEAVCNGENLKVMCDDHDLLDIELSDYPELANLPPKGFIAFQSRSGWMDIRNLMIQPCD
jgi:hypothetical protein